MKKTNKKVFAVIVAGGSGTRMGSDKPKQYLEIAGKPILVHTIGAFLPCDSLEKILVLCPKEWTEYTKELVEKFYGESAGRVEVLAGGSDRNETIMNAISYIEKQTESLQDIMLVTHDGVRPFVTKDMIEEQVKHVLDDKICEAVVPATDTIIISRDGKYLEESTDRSVMYQVQTPQSFPAFLMKKQYEGLSEEKKKAMTDAIGIFASNGEKIELLPGDVRNIKLTYPHDMVMAEAILSEKNKNNK